MLIYVAIFFFIAPERVLAAVKVDDAPNRISQFEDIFANVLVAAWALSVPYFIFIVASIGFRYMFAFGDEQKTGELKKKGGSIFFSFALVFGGYFVVRIVMSLLDFKDPSGVDCFTSAVGDVPFFEIFFPDVCK